MKPTSVISLIVAVLLVIAGLVTCIIAQNMANASGQFLFSEERDDNYVQTVDLNESDISRISLIVEDAQINIIGRAQSSYIEFINYRENYYSLAINNRVLSFDEIPDITSMLKFWENGFSFKGMRYIFNVNHRVEEDKQKIINIYLTNEKEIKIFDVTGKNCTVNLQNVTTGTDYNFVVDNLTLNAKNLRTTSVFNVNAGEKESPAKTAKITMESAMIGSLNIAADQLDMNASIFRATSNATIRFQSGSTELTTVRPISQINFDITNPGGQILIDGESVSSPYIRTTPDTSSDHLIIETENGSVTIKKADGNV